MAIDCGYHDLWFESFKMKGRRLPVQLRLENGQELPAEVCAICEERDVDPLKLLTRCNTDYQKRYPEGTRFLLEAKLTDREGGGVFFHAPYNWAAKKIIQ